MMKITVFTATYNRAGLIERVWKSLVEQNFSEMEWVLVDDGSEDGTNEVVEELRKESNFEIRYKWKNNGGKHTAINEGVRMAKGELFVMVDSDDELEVGALQDIWNVWSGVKEKSNIGGECGLMRNSKGVKIGTGFEYESIMSDSIEIRAKYKVDGDLMEVFRTDVLREFPFPEIEGERFCPEQLVWYRIAKEYKLMFVNRVWCVRDYIDGGLTDRIVRVRRVSPVASMMTYSEATRYDIGYFGKVRSAINYWRFWKPDKGVKIGAKWLWCAPLGWMMWIMDYLRK